MGNTSPVCKAIDKISDLFGVKDKVKTFSYKETDDFKELWRFFDLTDVLPSRIIVVWDGMPPRPTGNLVNTGKYLTPIDWAVGFSLAVTNRFGVDKRGEYLDLKILILDTGQVRSDSDSMKFMDQFPKRSAKSLPWIRIFSLDNPDSGWDMDNFFLDILDAGRSEDRMASMKEAFSKEHPDLNIIKNIWAASLTRPSEPGDHHALSNIIGPQLLIDEEEKDLHLIALRNLLEAIGLLPRKKEEAESLLKANMPWINWHEFEWSESLNNLLKSPGDKLNVILVDDMWESGWGKMLCWAVRAGVIERATNNKIGENEKVVIKAFRSADRILNRLEEFHKKNEFDKRFSLILDDDNKTGSPEILFLDLRLYTGKEVSKDEEEFFTRIIRLAEKLDEDKTKDLPWPGFKEDEIAKVRTWLQPENRKKESDGHITALTFLPRILALTDLSLPIVLFSSTGRRDITSKFEDYGTIITDFAKPRFTVDLPEDTAKQTRIRFIEALSKAFQILHAQKKCKDTVRLGSRKPSASIVPENKQFQVELFIDESFSRDQKTVYVGGLFAIYSADTVENARNKANKFDDDLVKAGVRYFDSLDVGIPQTNVKEKKESCLKELEDAINTSENKPDHLCFVRLGCTMPPTEGYDSYFDPKSGDNLFRMTLSSLIEFFLSETIPALFPKKRYEDVSISMFAGTRVKPFDENGREHLNKVMHETGLESFRVVNEETNRPEYFLKSMNRDSLFPLVSDILSYHNLRRNMHRLMAIALPYKTAKEGKVKDPVYFICRKCKEIASIDRGRDIKETLNDSKRKIGRIQRILTNANDQTLYAFVSILNDSLGVEEAKVFQDAWQDIGQAQDGQYITFASLRSRVHKITGRTYYTIDGARLLNQSEVTELTKIIKVVNKDVLVCRCKSGDKFEPDYRALHYVADEILNHVSDVLKGENYGKYIRIADFGFDDMLENAKNTLIASRYLDMKDIVSSIIQVSLDNIGNHSITHFLLRRQAVLLNSISGSDFCRIAANEGMTNSPTNYQFTRFLRNVSTKEKDKIVRPKEPARMDVSNIRSKSIMPVSKPICQKMLLVISERRITNSGFTELICTSENGETVKIARNQVKKYRLYNMKAGDKLLASIELSGSDYYGRDIEVIK